MIIDIVLIALASGVFGAVAAIAFIANGIRLSIARGLGL